MRGLTAALMAAALFTAPAAAQDAASSVSITDAPWAHTDAGDLQARIYAPSQPNAPILIDVHGGAWVQGARIDNAVFDTALAESGFLVIAVDYRLGAANPHPAASRDVVAAVRWARLNAQRLGGDPTRIGVIGASAGGHLAMLAALRPDDPSHRGVSIYDGRGRAGLHDDISADVNFVIALWPVSDPLYRYRYAKRAGLSGLVAASEAYFGDEAAMLDSSATRIIIAGEAPRLPPMLIVQPGADSNIPQDMTLDFIRAYQARDGAIEYAFYPGQPHSFGTSAGPQTSDMIALMRDFARRHTAQ